ncbi:NADH-quinone oxidoreductase subunit A [Deferrisoma camini]|uniref:NADH-quinone oxidoreductase subunit A n=1 Tax=Deferrisoma camini TaxID=1035120 RepID=UPI00046D0F42|nr:NADH-quinone oxidoreductase subunit A [Deferrisoma camini]
MDQKWVLDHAYVIFFLAVGLVVAAAPFLVSALMAPRVFSRKTSDTYECGMDPIGPAWIRYGVLYYLYALMFLAFDVDVLYLFPAALAYRKVPGFGVALEVILFVAVLALAIVYAWRKGVFTWPRKIQTR